MRFSELQRGMVVFRRPSRYTTKENLRRYIVVDETTRYTSTGTTPRSVPTVLMWASKRYETLWRPTAEPTGAIALIELVRAGTPPMLTFLPVSDLATEQQVDDFYGTLAERRASAVEAVAIESDRRTRVRERFRAEMFVEMPDDPYDVAEMLLAEMSDRAERVITKALCLQLEGRWHLDELSAPARTASTTDTPTTEETSC